jgi:hypothetical protein
MADEPRPAPIRDEDRAAIIFARIHRSPRLPDHYADRRALSR